MKKLIKFVKAFGFNSLDCLAPYTVINGQFGKCHFCWTYRAALEWLACYDAEFGATYVLNFNGEQVARKS
jgi:hypothetical protein